MSTSKSPSLAVRWNGQGYVYGVVKEGGIDVNATLGIRSPFPLEREVAFAGGIGPNNIVGAIRVENGQFTAEIHWNPFFSL